MLTRCPSCATVFRVTALQLKARQAMVRCGKCRHVFNALDSLIDAPQPAKEPAEEKQEAPSDEFPYSEPPEDPWDTASAPLLQEKEAAKRSAWPWAFGALLLSLLLLWQAVLHFRNELVVLFPEAKPALQKTCLLLGCKLSLPHKADLLSIEASDLLPDPDYKDRLLLSATLKNRAPFSQTYPHLELTLTDTADQPLLRKVFMPDEYLPKGINDAVGFAAGGEIVVNLALEVAGAGAAGYRLYLFYP